MTAEPMLEKVTKVTEEKFGKNIFKQPLLREPALVSLEKKQ
jgi:hypothetical protein